MRITLVRHGCPEIDLEELGNNWVTANEFGQVVDAYHHCDLRIDEKPPSDLVEHTSTCSVFLSSSVRRSKSSCIALGVEKVAEENPIFDEAAMPYATWKLYRLPIKFWSIFFRVAWLVGYYNHAQPVRAISERSKRAAELLIEQAVANGDVLLVGHGILNRMIASHLGKQHWRMVSSDGDGYWSYTIYEDPISTRHDMPLHL